MNKVLGLGAVAIYGTVPVLLQHISSKGSYFFQAVSQLSMSQTAILGLGVYVVAKVAHHIFSSARERKNPSFDREMFFTVLSGAGLSAVVLGLSSATVLSGATLAVVAFLVDSLFKLTLKLCFSVKPSSTNDYEEVSEVSNEDEEESEVSNEGDNPQVGKNEDEEESEVGNEGNEESQVGNEGDKPQVGKKNRSNSRVRNISRKKTVVKINEELTLKRTFGIIKDYFF